MNRTAKIIVSTRLERFEQYRHPAYRGAVDVCDESQFAVIPPGVDTAMFTPDPQPEDGLIQSHIEAYLARDLLAARRRLPALLMSARLDPKKNHVGLVRAFAMSLQLQEAANVVIITAGAEDPLRSDAGLSPAEREVMRAVRGLVAAHRLWGKISIFSLRGQPALAAAYRYFRNLRSVFVLPALYEPFGLAPLEAAACGLPVVVTRNGGPSESFREGNQTFGLLVNPEDPADIAAALVHVVLHADVWETLAQRGRKRVLNRYTWAHTAQRYEQVFTEILTNSGRPSRPRLPIHLYFLDPRPDTDVGLDVLDKLFFGK